MKINKHEIGEFGAFKIYESEGKEIVKKFIDFETKLLIVYEKYRDLNAYAGYSYIYTTIAPKTGDIIEINDRKNYINYNEIEDQDKESNLIWKTKRASRGKGNEAIKIEIYSPDQIETIKSEYNSAFSAIPHKPIPELYEQLIKLRNRDRIQKERALEEYKNKNYEERIKYWSGTLHQQMRWNVESGINAYDVFSKKWLEEVKIIEPQIEKLLDEVVEKYWKNYWDFEKIKEALKN